MDVTLNRLDPNVPDPVESRRRAAGRLVRIAYATIVFGVLAFFIIYFGGPFVFLGGPGTVSSARYVVSLPYTVQVEKMKLVPGAAVTSGEEIAEVISPEQDSIVATYNACAGGHRRTHGGTPHQGPRGTGVARDSPFISAPDGASSRPHRRWGRDQSVRGQSELPRRNFARAGLSAKSRGFAGG